MARKSNWEDVWAQFMLDYPSGPISWGYDDCMILAGKNIQALTDGDQDFWSEHEGAYSNQVGALLHLKSLGYNTPGEMLDGLGLPTRPGVGFAQRGDLVEYQGQIGICEGAHSLFRALEDELGNLVEAPVRISTLECDKAWEVS